MQFILDKLFNAQILTQQESHLLFSAMMRGELTEPQVAGALISMKMRGEAPNEIVGAALACLENAQPFPRPNYDFCDIVGTGGDHSNSINISTASAFVAAECGLKIAKHGNRSISSRSGSSDLLASFGIPLDMPPNSARRALDEIGICFLFAPQYHQGFGDNKVCGLTRPQDAQSAYQVGAIYGGLIFAEKSPRKVTLEQARAVITAAPLNYVGVFQHQVNSLIAEVSHQLNLFAVQLHGYKTAADIQQLRSLLPANCEIWQAVNMAQSPPRFNAKNIDRYLLDHGKGGTGKTFDWSKLPEKHLDKIMLAGGLNADNCQQAAALGCLGLDFNSGVEQRPGIKSCHKLQITFEKLFDYL